MIYRVIVTPAAERDLRTAYRYIRRQAPVAAREWIQRARQSAKSLARCPESAVLSAVLWLLRALHSTNLFASCFSAPATVGLIVFSLWCLINRCTSCMFGMDRCCRSNFKRQRTGVSALHYSGIFPCFFGGFLSRLV